MQEDKDRDQDKIKIEKILSFFLFFFLSYFFSFFRSFFHVDSLLAVGLQFLLLLLLLLSLSNTVRGGSKEQKEALDKKILSSDSSEFKTFIQSSLVDVNNVDGKGKNSIFQFLINHDSPYSSKHLEAIVCSPNINGAVGEKPVLSSAVEKNKLDMAR